MKVTLLGTGSSHGIPIIGSTHPVCLSTDTKDKRFRSSIMIEDKGCRIIIDCGPDFRLQMLLSKISSIDAVLFTHEHSDHTMGLDDLRPFCYSQELVPLYASKRVMNQLEKRFDYIFDHSKRKSPEVAKVKMNIIEYSPFKIKHLKIIPIKVWHGKLEILGYRINNFAYITDAKYLDSEEILKIKSVDVLIVNALKIDEHPTHFNLDEAINFSKEVCAKQTYFTHISHWLGLHKDINSQLPKSMSLGYDRMEISL